GMTSGQSSALPVPSDWKWAATNPAPLLGQGLLTLPLPPTEGLTGIGRPAVAPVAGSGDPATTRGVSPLRAAPDRRDAGPTTGVSLVTKQSAGEPPWPGGRPSRAAALREIGAVIA